jgi:hypothetical protein
VQHLLPHGTSVFKIISERSVILTPECRAPAEGAITTYCNVLGLARPPRAGLELSTSRMLSKSTTTRLPQAVNISSVRALTVYFQGIVSKLTIKFWMCKKCCKIKGGQKNYLKVLQNDYKHTEYDNNYKMNLAIF